MNESRRDSGLQRLPPSTVKLISSAQVITSVSSVVKELMENSLDARASCLEIHLDGHGLDRIEVKDNGRGIEVREVQYMCQRSYTSKISDFSDLEKLASYGFRGEALFSICAVADVSVTTISNGDPYARSYKMNHNGEVTETKPANLDKGTSVVVTNLFKNLPVRKQFLTSGKRKAEEMKNVETVVKALALVNCEVKIRLTHNKFTIWQKAGVCSIMRSFIQVLPPTVVKQLNEIAYKDEHEKIEFTLMVPKQDCNIVTTCLGHSSEAVYLFLNLRPVREKEIEKAVHDKVFEFFGTKIPAKKYPAMLVSIILPPDMIDVNLEPNKTKAMVKDVEKITKLLSDQLSIYYYGKDDETIMKEACLMEPPKRKLTVASRPSSPSKKKPKKDFDESNDFANLTPSPSNGEIETDTSSNLLNFQNSGGVGVSPSEAASTLDNTQRGTELNGEDATCRSIESNDATTAPTKTMVATKTVDEKSTTISAFLDGIESRLLLSPNPAEIRPVEEDCLSKAIVPDDPFDLLKKNKTPDNSNVESDFFSQPLFEDPWNDVNESPLKSNADASSETSKKSLIKSINDGSSKQSTDLDEFSLSCWSRGDVRIDGKKLEGTTAIGGGLFEEEMSAVSTQSPSSGERSVSSQMGQKDMSAFTKFARQMRVEIVKAQPGISFPKIAKELSKRWQELQDEDKKTYEEIALADKQEKKIKGQENKRGTNRASENTKSFKPLFVKKYHTVEKVAVQLSDIRERLLSRNAVDFDDDLPEIIANLNEDLSIVKGKSTINIFSCRRLDEAIKFYNNMTNMFLDLKVLEDGIEITRKELGPLWEVLETLDSGIDVNLQANQFLTSNVISDERITKNGLRINKLESSSGNKYTITDVAKNIANFGLCDLKEILSCISKNANCRLRECRPLSVVNLIRSETVRSLVGHTSTRTDYTIDLYKHWYKKISKRHNLCPHHNLVAQQIFPQS